MSPFGDFSGFEPASQKRVEDTLSYKFFSALDVFKKKAHIPNLPEKTVEKVKDVAQDVTTVVGQGMAAVGEEVANIGKIAVNQASMRRFANDAQPIGQAFRERAAAVGEDRELRQKEKEIRPRVESEVMNANPTHSKKALSRDIEYKVAEELLKGGIFTDRPTGTAAVFTQGLAQGASYGIFDGYASEAIKLARMMKNPYSTEETVSNVAGNLLGGLLAYGAMSQRIGAGLKTVPELKAFAGNHKFLFNAGIQNLGEEVVDMSIRKATGQTYTKSDFLLGMGFGATAETLFAGVRMLKNMNLTPVQKQLNQEVETFMSETGRYPDFETELYPRLENVPMAGAKMTYGEAFRSYSEFGERRMAFFSGIDPNTGLPKAGNPQPDMPSFKSIDEANAALFNPESSNEVTRAAKDYLHTQGVGLPDMDELLKKYGTMDRIPLAEFDKLDYVLQDNLVKHEGALRTELQNLVEPYREILTAGRTRDLDQGFAFAKELRKLERMGAFKFAGKRIADLDEPSAVKLLDQAMEQHRGKPIGAQIEQVLKDRSRGTYGVLESHEDFQRGFAEGANAKLGETNLVNEAELLIERKMLAQDMVIDEQGTTVRQLLNDYQSALNRRFGLNPGAAKRVDRGRGQHLEAGNPTAEFRVGRDGQPRRITATELNRAVKGEPSPFVKKREATLLKYKLNAEARGARRAFFTTKRSIKEVQEDLIDYAKETLGAKERGQILPLLKNTQDSKGLKRAIGKVNEMVSMMNKREQIADIKSVMKADVLEKLPVSTRKQLVDHLSSYALSKPTSATRTLGEQVEQELELGTEELAPALLKKAEQIQKQALADLDPEELWGLHKYVQDTVEQGKVAMLLLKSEKAFDVKSTAQDVEMALDWWAAHGANPGKFMKGLWFADLEYTTPDRFFDMLDGFKGYKGTMYNTFKTPVDAATSGFLRDHDRFLKEASEQIDLNHVSKESMDRIGIYGLWQRSDGGKLIGREKLRQRGIEEPPELTEAEQKIYTFMRQKFDELYPRVEKTLADSENRSLGAGVQNYWPMLTDYDADQSIRDVIRQNSFNLSRDAEAGFTQKAVGGNQTVELNAGKVFMKHSEDALYFIHLQPVLDKLNAVVDFRIPAGLEDAGTQVVKEKLGRQGAEYVMRYLNTVSTNGAPAGVGGGWAGLSHVIRNNTSLAVMGGNVATTLKQPLSMLNAAAYVGPHRLLRSMVKIGTMPIEGMNGNMRFILDSSAEIRNRSAGEHALYELAKDGTWLERVPLIGKGVKGTRNLSFYLLKRLDSLSAMSVWDATYTQAIKNMDHQRAVFEADRVVRLTQSSGMAKDMPFVMQRGELSRLLHQFQTFVINDWNIIKHDIVRSGLMRGGGEKTAGKRFGKRAQALTALTFMATAGMLEDLISAGGDWEKAKEGGLVMGNFAQKVPMLGRFISVGKFGGTSVPAIDAALVKPAQSFYKLMDEDLSDNQKEKELIQLGQSAGSLFGIPFTGQFAKQAKAARRARMEEEKGVGGDFSNVDFSGFSPNFGSSGNFGSISPNF